MHSDSTFIGIEVRENWNPSLMHHEEALALEDAQNLQAQARDRPLGRDVQPRGQRAELCL